MSRPVCRRLQAGPGNQGLRRRQGNRPRRAASTAADPHAGVPGMTPGAAMPGGADRRPPCRTHADQMAAVGANSGPQVTDSPPAHWKKQAALVHAAGQLSGRRARAAASVDISLVDPARRAGRHARQRQPLARPTRPAADRRGRAQTNLANLNTPWAKAVAVEIEGLAPGADAAKDGRMIGVIAEQGRRRMVLQNARQLRSNRRGEGQLPQVGPHRETRGPGGSRGAPAATPPRRRSPRHPPVPPPAAAADGSVTWQLPAGWTLAPAAGSMRYATFSMAAADGAKGELVGNPFPRRCRRRS